MLLTIFASSITRTMKITNNSLLAYLVLACSFLGSIQAMSQTQIRSLAARALQNEWTQGGGSWQEEQQQQDQRPFTLVELGGQIDGSVMAFRVNPNDARVGADTISIVYQVPTLAWAAIGFSGNGGNMVGSEAVIAVPATGQILKYNLGGKSLQGVQPMPANQQTLVESGLIQEQGTTTFAFTKIMNESGEVPILTGGINTFLGAWGNSDTLGIHAVRQPFNIDLGNGAVELVVPPAAQPPPVAQTQPPANNGGGGGGGAVAVSGELTAIDLDGQLEGSTLEFQVNAADPNAGGQDTITISYTVPVLAWAGVAFSNNGGFMIGSEAIIGLPDSGEVLKYSLTGKTADAVVPMDDAQQTLIDTSITQDGVSTTLTFTKILVEANEIPISTGVNTFLGAWGINNGFGIHAARQSISVDLASGGVEDLQTRKQSYWKAHGFFAGIAWGILSPLAISASVVRKLFKGPLWFQLHRGLNMCVVLFTIIAFILAVVAINLETPAGASADHFNPNPNPHRMVGLVIFIIAIVQALMGIFRPHATEPGETKSTVRYAWEISHRVLGFACLFMAIYQVQSGIKIYQRIFTGEAEYALIVFWTIIVAIFGACFSGLVAIQFFGVDRSKTDDSVKKSTKSTGSNGKDPSDMEEKEQPTQDV
ncbi:MAG: hypothetical protein SGILL_004159 [Bacillariaceae sp.]